MHHIPRFFFNPNKHNNSSSGSSSTNRRKPKKLDRKNAQKNIDYQPPSSSATTSFSDDSLDYFPPFITSFRVQGTDDGEIGSICELLGLSGPDDLGISLDAWESRKIKSTSHVSGGLGEPDVHSLINPTITENTAERLFPETEFKNRILEERDVLTTCTDTENTAERLSSETDLREPDVLIPRTEKTTETLFLRPGFGEEGCGDDELDYRERVGELGEEFSDVVRVSDVKLIRGIKGVRPPFLVAPPPVSGMRIVDDECSTWDILRSLDGGGGGEGMGFVYGREDEDQGFDGENNGVVSGSCSFTTSIDDDCSSTTTDPQSNISPQGRSRRFISLGNWDKGKLLGQGSFGSVYEGIADDGTFFAVKEVSLLDQGDKGRQSIFQLEQEISLLSKFKHENIVQYYGTKKNESTLYIFLELASKGSLFSLYQQYHLRDSQASVYTWQILQGLKYLHDRNVIHRDIKCGNILVDTYGTVKLADFGLAKATKLNDVKSCKGSPFWMAPEVVKRSEGYGLAADIWSLGCTVLEMLTGQLPYFPLDGMQALYRIGNCEPPPVPDSFSRDAQDFILQCLQVNPSSRPTAAKLLNHSFVKREFPYSLVSASPQNPHRRL